MPAMQKISKDCKMGGARASKRSVSQPARHRVRSRRRFVRDQRRYEFGPDNPYVRKSPPAIPAWCDSGRTCPLRTARSSNRKSNRKSSTGPDRGAAPAPIPAPAPVAAARRAIAIPSPRWPRAVTRSTFGPWRPAPTAKIAAITITKNNEAGGPIRCAALRRAGRSAPPSN